MLYTYTNKKIASRKFCSESNDTTIKVMRRDTRQTFKEYRRTCLSKSKCNSVFRDEYKVLPAMQYTGDTLFSYYVSVYSIPNLIDLVYSKDIRYQTTCCGKTIYNGAESSYDKNHFMHDMANQIWERLKQTRAGPLRPPYETTMPILPHINEIDSPSNEAEGAMYWDVGELPSLTLAPRIYLDMVVTTPDRNLRIIFKIIEKYKCDIWWNFLEEKETGEIRDLPSCFDYVPYKHFLEYGDRDNPMEYLFMESRLGELDKDSISRVFNTFKRTSWYFEKNNIEKTISGVVRYMDRNDISGMSIKDSLNVSNAMITDIKTGTIVGKVNDEDLQDKVQFGLFFSWLLLSGLEDLVKSKKPYEG